MEPLPLRCYPGLMALVVTWRPAGTLFGAAFNIRRK